MYALSRFRCGKRNPFHLSCECGSNLLEISRKGREAYWLRVLCNLCETEHVFHLSGAQIWNKKALSLHCENTQIVLGYLGSKEEVLKAINEEADLTKGIAAQAAQLENRDFYVNSAIMLQVLEALRKIDEQGQISCSCGRSELEFETYPDRVEIRCVDCQAVGIVFAESVRDLRNINKTEAIQLAAATRKYIDDSSFRGKKKVKNK
jgi:ribosomal protein S27E